MQNIKKITKNRKRNDDAPPCNIAFDHQLMRLPSERQCRQLQRSQRQHFHKHLDFTLLSYVKNKTQERCNNRSVEHAYKNETERTEMIDLHTHSNASDGFLTPTELLRAAEKLELEALALTDHDAVSGLKELHQAALASHSKIELVNGSELSVYYPHVQMEILALDIPEKNLPAFEAYQQSEVERREQMAHKRLELLQNLGIDIEFEEVAKDEHGRKRTQIRRPHFTDVLLKKGYIQNAQEAYKVLFARGGVAYVENKPKPAQEIIEFIRANGAKAILAHPVHTKLAQEDLYNTIKELQGYGLNGVEIFHSAQPRANRQIYLDIIKDLGLLASGGSDFHGGTAHPENKLGTGRFHNLNMPYMILSELRSEKTPSSSYYTEIEKVL